MIHERVLQPRLAEVGRIKIGGLETNQDGSAKIRTSGKGRDWQAPVKYDHFVLTTMDRDASGNFSRDESIIKAVGSDKPTELDIILLYNDIDLNFRTELGLYSGKTVKCRGDGLSATYGVDKKTGEVQTKDCPCDLLTAEGTGKCKPHGTLTCLLRYQEITGGSWKFSTTSWNTIRNIIGSLKFISLCTGGKLAGLPLKMKFMKKSANITVNGEEKQTTIGVVGIFYEGNPIQLLESAIQQERKRLEAGIRMETLEDAVRKELKALPQLDPIDPELNEEMHPIEEPPPLPETPKPTVGAAIADAAKTPPVSPSPVFGNGPAAAAPGTGTATGTPQPDQPKGDTPKDPPQGTNGAAGAAGNGSSTAEKKPAGEKSENGKSESGSSSAANATSGSSSQPSTIDKDAILREIAALRSKHQIVTGEFAEMVKAAIGKAKINVNLWTPEEAQAIRDQILKKVGNGGSPK